MKPLSLPLAACALFVIGCSSGPSPAPISAARPADASRDDWAQRTAKPGLPNLARVDDNLWRGGKPDGVGFATLKTMGVRTVVDLGLYFFEVDNLNDRQLAYEHIPFYTWTPRDADVARFLRIATSKSRGPVYVHCRKGADRTGLMCAVYRVVVSGWTKQQAIDEMTRGGFGFDPQYQHLVQYVRNLDTAAMARRAGLPEPVTVASAW